MITDKGHMTTRHCRYLRPLHRDHDPKIPKTDTANDVTKVDDLISEEIADLPTKEQNAVSGEQLAPRRSGRRSVGVKGAVKTVRNMGVTESKMICSCECEKTVSIQCNCSNPRVPWGRYKSGCNSSRSATRTASRSGCSSGRTGRTGSNLGPPSGSHKHTLGRATSSDTGSGSNMRLNLGPTSSFHKHTLGRATSSATGSSSSTRSEPPRTGTRARTVEVITLSSGSEYEEDLEIIVARLRKAKGL